MSVDVHALRVDEVQAVIEALPARAPERHRSRFEAQAHGGFVYLIAWLDGRPVGFVGVGLHDDGAPDTLAESRGYAMVSDLHVEETYRRRGAARALMAALEDEARSAGMPGVILDTGVDEDLAAARALYRALGYQDHGGAFLGGWSNPHRPGEHFVDTLTLWTKPL